METINKGVSFQHIVENCQTIRDLVEMDRVYRGGPEAKSQDTFR